MKNLNKNASMFNKFETAKIVGMNEIIGGSTVVDRVPSGRGDGYRWGELVSTREEVWMCDDGSWCQRFFTAGGDEWTDGWHRG